MRAANAIVDLGFKDAGYEYVILDDCWSEMTGRDPVTSRLLPNTTKFPDGMSGTADQVHALGLKWGMYSSAGTMTCGRYPGSLGVWNLFLCPVLAAPQLQLPARSWLSYLRSI